MLISGLAEQHFERIFAQSSITKKRALKVIGIIECHASTWNIIVIDGPFNHWKFAEGQIETLGNFKK